MPDIMKVGLELDPTGMITGGTAAERILERMAVATERTEIEIMKLVDAMLTTPGAAAKVEAALSGVATAEAKVATSSELMIAGMSASSRAMSASEGMILGMSYAATSGAGSVEKVGVESRKTERSMHILGRRFGHMAGEVAGMARGTTRATEQLMMLGMGGVATVAITAGIFAIGSMFEYLRSEEEKTKKETEELIKKLNEAGQARMQKNFPGQSEDEQKHEAEMLKQLGEARKKLARAERGTEVYDNTTQGVAFVVSDRAVKKAKAGLKEINTALYEFYSARNEAFGNLPAEQNRIYFEEMTENLKVQAYAIDHTAEEVAQYAIQFDKKLNPAQQETIRNSLRLIDVTKRVHDALKESWTAGSNRVPGMPQHYQDNNVPDGSNYAPGVPDFLKGTGQGINSKASADKFLARQAATTAHYVEIWTQASAAVQDAIIGVFEAGPNDHIITDFFERILTAFRNMLAEMAFEAMRSGIEKILGQIFGFVAKGIGGAAGDAFKNAGGADGIFHPEGGNALASIGRVGSGDTTVVHQSVSFSITAMDARSVHQVLMEQRGTIAAVVAQAAQQSRAYRRALGGN